MFGKIIEFLIVSLVGGLLVMIMVTAINSKIPEPCGLVSEKHTSVINGKTEYSISVPRQLPATVSQELWNEINLGDYVCGNILYRKVKLITDNVTD